MAAALDISHEPLIEVDLGLVDIAQLRRDLARASFKYYVHMVMPDWGWPLPWFHERICDELQTWWESETTYNLILELPPGHSKSWYAKLFVTWAFGRDPDLRAAYTGYGQDLAEEHSGDIQGVMLGEDYRELFPDTALNTRRMVSDDSRGAKRTKDEFHVVGRVGRFRAVGIGGPLTGFRCDLGIIDDPLKNAKDAASPTMREDQWRWYTRVLKTRKRPKRKLKLLLLLTRWHLDDIAGRVQAREAKRWRVLRFPAIKEEPPSDHDPREVDEALWPDVATREELEELRESDPEGFGALYQCRPVSEGGNVFKWEWFADRWEHLAELTSRPGEWVQSWDCRNDGKDMKKSSRVSAGLWFFPAGEAVAYCVDVRSGRWSPDETLTIFDALQDDPLWARAGARLIEAKADGKMLLSLRQRKYPGMTPIEPSGDKVTRAKAVTPFCAARNVRFAAEGPYLAEVLDEVCTFPGAPTDDHVDMMSQVLAWKWLAPVTKNAPPPDPLEAARARKARHGVRQHG